MKTTILAASIFLCACSSVPTRSPAQAQVGAGQAWSQDRIEAAAQKYAEMLRPRVFELQQSLLGFNYASVAKDFRIGSLDDERRHLLSTFSSSQPGEFYLAMEPNTSSDYGWPSPRLIVVELKTGSRILNDYAYSTPEEIKKIKEILTFADEPREYSDPLELIFSATNLDQASMRNLNRAILARLQVSIEMYSFRESKIAGCRTPPENPAFIVLEPSVYTLLAYYSADEGYESLPLAAQIARLQSEISVDVTYSKHPLPKKIDELASKQNLSEKDYRAWKNRYIVNCGPERSFEQ